MTVREASEKHGTSSVFVFCRMAGQWRIGLIVHPRFGRLMMPGGHVERTESPGEAALREVAEESGLAVQLVSPPTAPLPAGYQPARVAQPWWIVEYRVPADGHLAAAHVHVDHLYVAVAGDPAPVSNPGHPFGWYAAADLPAADMFPDARRLATAMLTGLGAGPGGEVAVSGVPGPGGEVPDHTRLAGALLAGLARSG